MSVQILLVFLYAQKHASYVNLAHKFKKIIILLSIIIMTFKSHMTFFLPWTEKELSRMTNQFLFFFHIYDDSKCDHGYQTRFSLELLVLTQSYCKTLSIVKNHINVWIGKVGLLPHTRDKWLTRQKAHVIYPNTIK